MQGQERVLRRWNMSGSAIPVHGLVCGIRRVGAEPETIVVWGAMNGLRAAVCEAPVGSLRPGEQLFTWPGGHPAIGPDHPTLTKDGGWTAGVGWTVGKSGEHVPQLLEAVALAVRFSLPIVVGYVKDGAERAEERRLSLVRGRGENIVAADADRGAARTFKLDRVSYVRPGDGVSWPVWDASLRDYRCP